jgi:subtilase family serine protease
MKRISLISVFIFSILLVSAAAQSGRIHPALEERLQRLAPGERLPVIVELVEQARPAYAVSAIPGASRRQRARAVVNALQNMAAQQQGLLRAHLKQEEAAGAAHRVIPFWIFNGLAVTADEPLIRSLAARPDVREVRLDARIPVPPLTPAAAGASAPAAEWNIGLIRAPEVWALNPAYNGAGTVIASFDTGVDLTHPDLYSRYRGNHHISWFDPYNEHSIPFDSNGHGTHTTGIALGGNASGSYIGVAPGATWVAAKAWDDAGVGLVSAFHQIFEWFLAPGGDPDNAPDVVNSSWSFDETGCITEFLPDVQALRAAGIFPAFAAGNNGPAPGSVLSPAAYPISFAVGATDYADRVAYFSAQGPSPCDGSVKPDIGAPGDIIFSAVPWGYEVLSGTSMAAPHVTGAVAVLRSINPALTVDQLESALISGAKDLEDPGPDYISGAGRLDLFVSGQVALLGPDFPVVKILATDAIATEAGPTSGTFKITRTGNTDQDLEVKYSTSGTATAGADYESIPDRVTIAAGSAEATILVTAIDDSLAEVDETVSLTIIADPAYIVSATDSATVTIQSDELISDLVISAVSIPTTGGAGQSILIAETVKNQGQGTSDPCLVEFYLSTDATLDAADGLLGGRSVPALVSGATSSGSTSATIPQDTPGGVWYVIIKADAEEVVTETSEANNTSARSIKIGPDLAIPTLSAPLTAGAGQNIAITETVKNQGGGDAGNSLIQFYLSTNTTLDAADTLIGSRNVPALAAGAASSGSTTVTIPQDVAAGYWYIVARADAEDVVAETSEANNGYARSIRIGPDLDITALSAPSAAGAGQSIVIADTVTNQGGGSAEPSLTQFYLSTNTVLDAADTLIGSRNVPALAGGAASSASTTVTIPQDTATGSWYIIAKADGDDVVPETSETNNTSASWIGIGPDLVITSLSAPLTTGAGQSIAITEATKNQGGGTTEPSLTQFYLSANSILDSADTLIGGRSVPALGPGASSSGSATIIIPQDTATGYWYIIAKADGEEVVSEISEANNTSAWPFRIGPDLDITAMSAPTTAGAGQSIVITETTKNQGGGTAATSLTQFCLSANSALDEADTLLGGRNVPALAAGAASSASTTVTIPQDMAGGNWYIIAKADGEEVVEETSETNNTYAWSIKIGSDLIITSLSVPTTAGAGQSIAVTETTKNQGGGTANASLTQFYLSVNGALDAADTLLGGRNVPALASGTTSSASTMVTIPLGTATGSWYLIAKADGEEVVIETSETNNTYSRSIKVGPDLAIPSLSAPTSGGAGQSVTVAETTKNQGGGSAGPSLTQSYLSANTILDASDALIGGRNVPALAAGAMSSASTTITIPQGTATGYWYIIVEADAGAAVAETSETNNSSARLIMIGPDLDVITLSLPTSAGAGQSIVVTDTVKNIGGGLAASSLTRLYLSTNTTLDASDALIGSRSVPALVAGAMSSGSTTVTIPQGTTAGYWYIIAKADGDDVVAEISETNNTYARYILIK